MALERQADALVIGDDMLAAGHRRQARILFRPQLFRLRRLEQGQGIDRRPADFPQRLPPVQPQ